MRSRLLRVVMGLLRAVVAGILVMGTGACMYRDSPARYAPLRHPFRDAMLYLDTDSLAAHWQRAHDAPWLDPITTTPQARWLTGPREVTGLGPTVQAARHEGALLVLIAYYIPNRDCAGPDQGAADAAGYDKWIGQLVTALAAAPAVVILEPDAVAADCFDQTRAQILADAVHKLGSAGHYVYLDAGHSRWRPAREMAERLHDTGIAGAEGFSVNVSNRQSTPDSHRYALELSALVGDREAVIDTSRNGLHAPPDDQWCNPALQGLGQPPTTDPGLDKVAALLWVKRPGESDGPCGGETSQDIFSPRQAQTLIANAAWVPETTRRQAAAARLP